MGFKWRPERRQSASGWQTPAAAGAPGEWDAGASAEVSANGIRDEVAMLRPSTGERGSPRRRTMLFSGVAGAALVAASFAIPVPYVAQSPGPTLDTLDSFDGKPLVEIVGAEVYPTEGELRLTTVAVHGGPGHRMTAGRMLRAWLDPNSVVFPIERYYPPRASKREIEENAQLEMSSSQVDAAVAALTEVGMVVPTTLTVASVKPGGAAEGVVEVADVLQAITVAGKTTPIVDFAALTSVLSETPPGTPVVLTVKRDGKLRDLTFPTGSRKERDAAAGLPVGDEPDGSVLGVGLIPDAELPVEVKYQIDDVGGPSAGLMFALATVDKLTPGALTGGWEVAGTGTISLDGSVGPIGGIRQKIIGAADDGARYFLAPQANCEELTGHVPSGVTAFPVNTLAQAREVLETLARDDAEAVAALPTCG